MRNSESIDHIVLGTMQSLGHAFLIYFARRNQEKHMYLVFYIAALDFRKYHFRDNALVYFHHCDIIVISKLF